MRRTLLLAQLATIFLALACSRHTSDPDPVVAPGGTPPGATTADILISDATIDDLFSFSAVVSEVRLREVGGTLTADLLDGDVTVEFLHLDDEFVWLSRVSVDEGDYDAVVVRFLANAFAASAQDGTAVDVDETSLELIAPLAAPMTAAGEPYARIEIDLDLATSLTGDVSSGTVTFDPTGTTNASDGTVPVSIESRLGIVRARDFVSQVLQIDVFADQSLGVPIGSVTARVPTGALLVDPADFVQQSVPYFFTFLIPGLSVVDVHGMLGANGELLTTRLEIEEQNGTVVSPIFPLKLEGRVVSKQSPFVFTMRVRSVRRGSNVLSGSDLVDVLVDPQLGLFFEGSTLADPNDIDVGIDVDLKSSQLLLSPVIARRVQIGEVPAINGVVASTAGVPASITINLDPMQPALSPGQVLSPDTDVTVLLPPGAIFLDTPIAVPLAPTQIRSGLEIDVRGSISGPPSMPTLDATRIDVRPGRLVGATAIAPSAVGFTTDGGSIASPFGPNLTAGMAGPMQVETDAKTVFRGAASSMQELNQLLFLPDPVTVTVQGIESDTIGRIVGFDVFSQW